MCALKLEEEKSSQTLNRLMQEIEYSNKILCSYLKSCEKLEIQVDSLWSEISKLKTLVGLFKNNNKNIAKSKKLPKKE